MTTRVATRALDPEWPDFCRGLLELTKPGVTRLVVLTTALGAAMVPGDLSLVRLAWTLLGTVLVVGSANALNMYLEHEQDGLMARTAGRPLPTGRLSLEVALAFGLGLGVVGVSVLATLVNGLTGELAMLAILSYVLIYTPMKVVSPAALYLGAVPGALPPLLGYAGMHGELNPQAWSVFAVLFVWQIPHFLAITVFRCEEYGRAGLLVLPVVRGIPTTKRAIKTWAIVFWLTSLAPCALGLGGVPYAFVAGISGAAFAAFAFVGQRDRTDAQWARTLFFATMPHLVLLFTTLSLTAP